MNFYRTEGNIKTKAFASSSLTSPAESSSCSAHWDTFQEILLPESPKEAQDPIFLSDNEQVENNSTKKNISSSTLTMKRKLQELNQDIPQKLKLKKKDCTAQPTAMLSKSIDNAFEKLNQLVDVQPTREVPKELKNSNYLFGRTIALMLEELEPQQQLIMRKKIMKLWAESDV